MKPSVYLQMIMPGKRVAAHDPVGGDYRAGQQAVFLDGLSTVIAATGIELAGETGQIIGNPLPGGNWENPGFLDQIERIGSQESIGRIFGLGIQ